MIKRGFIVLFLLISLSIFAEEVFRVIEINENYVKVKFVLPDFMIEELEVRGEVFHKIICEDGNIHSKEGFPLLPYFSDIVGLPVDGSMNMELISEISEFRENINVYPAEEIDTENEARGSNFYKNFNAYRSTSYYPRNIVENGNKAFLGDRHFQGFLVNAFQFKPSEHKLKIIKEAVIGIHISGDTSINRAWNGSTNFIDKAGDDFFINNQFSKKWRKAVESEPYTPTNRSTLVNEIQLIVRENGIYKIDYDYLVDSVQVRQDSLNFNLTFDWETVDPHYFELSDKNGPIPIRFVGERDASFDEGDYFEFYGERHAGENSYYDDYTEENVYVLSYTDHFGARMAVENAGINNLEPLTLNAFQEHLHIEEQNSYQKLGFYGYPSYDLYKEDIWFWKKITGPNNLDETEFVLHNPLLSATYQFDAEVSLMGYTHDKNMSTSSPNHSAIVSIQTAIIDDIQWYNQDEQIFRREGINNSVLADGINKLWVMVPGDTYMENEQVLLDYIDITYWREFIAFEDYLKFSKPNDPFYEFGTYEFDIDNFSNDNVSVYKIGASYLENIQVLPFTETGGAPFRVVFQDRINSDNVEYIAVTEDEKKIPIDIKINIPSDLKNPATLSNYIIITATDFVDDEGTLLFKETWEQYGQQVYGKDIRVEIVDQQDIYDEFNHGIRSSEAIRDFLKYAYNNWNYAGSGGTERISHVLLLGDGTFDERDFSTSRKYNIIPTRYVWTYKHGATASDNWFVSIVGDDPVPDISISRINVWEAEQILPVAQKTLKYITEPNYDDHWHSHVTLAAGGKSSDDYDIFAVQSERIRKHWIPEDYKVNRVYTATSTVSSDFKGSTSTLKDEFDNGTMFLQFMGHGGGRIWADYNLLNYNDIKTLTNDNLPFVSSLACYASAFDTNGGACIGEAFILEPERGAICHLGFSGLGYLYADEYFARHLTEAIFDKKYGNVGESTLFTVAKFYSQGGGHAREALTKCCVILGDPMIKMDLPTEKIDIELDKNIVVTGDTLRITVKAGSDMFVGKIFVCNENEKSLNLPYNLPVINGEINYEFIIPPNTEESYTWFVKAVVSNNIEEKTGMVFFSSGEECVNNVSINPIIPTEKDSIEISVEIFADEEIESVTCHVIQYGNIPEMFIPMTYNSVLKKFVIDSKIPAFSAGSYVSFKFKVYTSEKFFTSEMYHYTVEGAQLNLVNVQLTQFEQQPALKILIENLGSLASPVCDLKIYKAKGISQKMVLFVDEMIEPLASLDKRWEIIPLPVAQGDIQFKIVVNQDESFTEEKYDDNVIDISFLINMNLINNENYEISSLDENVVANFSQTGLSENSIVYINKTEVDEKINQPDIISTNLSDEQSNCFYEIGLLDESVFVDTTGLLIDNKKFTINFFYNTADSLTNLSATNQQLNVYRWEKFYKKWIYQGGQIVLAEGKVVANVKKAGIYSLFINTDIIAPSIEANVENQEFSFDVPQNEDEETQKRPYGKYISGTGIVSFVFSDANGIDMFDNPIQIFLNMELLDPSEYSLSVAKGELINIPVKYQLNLPAGEYDLILSCTDVNGNVSENNIDFVVNDKFDILNLANYPNPVSIKTIDPDNQGRTRFMYILTDDADEVSIKVYTVTGRLVKQFKNLPVEVGYHEYPRTKYGWDCKDDKGFELANGVYFYRITAKKKNKTIKKIEKMAILK